MVVTTMSLNLLDPLNISPGVYHCTGDGLYSIWPCNDVILGCAEYINNPDIIMLPGFASLVILRGLLCFECSGAAYLGVPASEPASQPACLRVSICCWSLKHTGH